MNYRHAFHAGNFADLAKHALLLAALEAWRPVRVIDTHAGAGFYDLRGEDARRTAEAQAGAARLMADDTAPPAFASLKAAVRRANPQGGLRWYPGSPKLAVDALAPGASYTGFELDPDALAGLGHVLRAAPRGVQAKAVAADGYDGAARLLARGGRTLALVDPPFERSDDYDRIVALASRLDGDTGALIWLPLKDLETFDAFLSRLEAQRPASLAVWQVRLRPLHDPMRMNGCALAALGLPDLDTTAHAVCGWVAGALGEAGAEARVERLAG